MRHRRNILVRKHSYFRARSMQLREGKHSTFDIRQTTSCSVELGPSPLVIIDWEIFLSKYTYGVQYTSVRIRSDVVQLHRVTSAMYFPTHTGEQYFPFYPALIDI